MVTSLRPFVFVDTETTGLDPEKGEIIEITILIEYPLDEKGIGSHTIETTRKIKPTRLDLSDPDVAGAVKVNGYTEEAWEDALELREVLLEISDLPLLRNGVLVGHNVSFDEAFIKAAFSKENLKYPLGHHKIDTVSLAIEHLSPIGLSKPSLDTIRGFLGWPNLGAHTSSRDAQDTRRLFHLLFGGLPFWKRLWYGTVSWSQRLFPRPTFLEKPN